MPMTESAKIEYEQDVVRSAEKNHLWINAFACVRPTKELCETIGREVLQKLGGQDKTIVSILGRDGHMLDGFDKTSHMVRELVMRFNKS